MAAQPAPAGPARKPPARRVSYVQDVVVLYDWWLKRVEGEDGKICVEGFVDTEDTGKPPSVSKGSRKRGARLMVTSAPIAKRLDHNMVETVDGKVIRFMRMLNYTRMHESGFSDEVCECFEIGFPIGWEKIANSNMEQVNGHARSLSKSTANAPSDSIRNYIDKLVADGYSFATRYAYGWNDFNSSRFPASNTDGPPIQRHSSVSNGNTCNSDSSMRKIGGGRMDIPKEPLAPPGETCNSGQADDQHESLQKDAREHEVVNRSVSVKQSTGPMCSDSDINKSAPSRIASVETEAYSRKVDCGGTEQDVDIEHEHSCSSEQEMVTHPVDSALVNNYMSYTSCEIGERGTPKCGETSVNLGTAGATDVPIERMTTQSSAVQDLQDSTARRLRNGKVCGMPYDAPMERGNKQKRMQHEASDKNAVQGLENNKVMRLRSGKVFGMACGTPVERGNERKKTQHEASNEKVARSSF